MKSRRTDGNDKTANRQSQLLTILSPWLPQNIRRNLLAAPWWPSPARRSWTRRRGPSVPCHASAASSRRKRTRVEGVADHTRAPRPALGRGCPYPVRRRGRGGATRAPPAPAPSSARRSRCVTDHSRCPTTRAPRFGTVRRSSARQAELGADAVAARLGAAQRVTTSLESAASESPQVRERCRTPSPSWARCLLDRAMTPARRMSARPCVERQEAKGLRGIVPSSFWPCAHQP